MSSRTEPHARVRPAGWLLLFCLAAVALAPAALAQQPEPPPAATAEQSIRDEVDRLFRVTRLRSGVLLEPRSDMDGVAAIEISDGTLVVDGEVVSPEDLETRLGAAADVVRRLAEVEARNRPETFDGESSRRARRPPPPPEPPAVPAPERRSRIRHDSQVVVGSSLTVEADEEFRDIVVFGGRLTVRGTVVGDALAIGGAAHLEPGGEVTGDLMAIGGPTVVGPGARVEGDAVSVGNRVRVDDGATIGGKVVEVPFPGRILFDWPDDANWDFDWGDYRWDSHYAGGLWRLGSIFSLFWSFFGLLLLALLACVAYLLARAPIERMSGKLRSEPWKAGLVGLVAQLLLVPLLVLVCLILVISIIGIPLLLLVPFVILAVIVVAFLGYTASAVTVGRWAERRFGWKMVTPYVALVVGIGLIQVLSFVGDVLDLLPGPLWLIGLMFGVFGFLIEYAAWTAGLGAALLTRFGTLDDPMAAAPAAALPPLPQPGPPSPGPPEPSPPEALPDLDFDTAPEEPGDDAPFEPDVGSTEPEDKP